MELTNTIFVVIASIAAVLVFLGVCICVYILWRRSSSSQANNFKLKEEDLEPLLNNQRTVIGKSDEEKKREIEAKLSIERTKEKQGFELNAKMYLRTTNYTNPSLVEIGTRSKKWYFQTTGTKDIKGDFLMTMVTLGNDCKIFDQSEKTVSSFYTFLASISNPYILPLSGYQYQKDKNVFVGFRPSCPTGSLRDIIYGASPLAPATKKYSKEIGTPLSEAKLKKWGREILEGLDYLQSQKPQIPFRHLHSGNVIIDNGVCRISDWENDFLCVLPKTASFLKQAKEMDPWVVSFGYVLFEMACGFTMDFPTIDTVPQSCNGRVKKILRSIFSAQESEETPQTIRSLLKNSFFDVVLYSTWVPKAAVIDARMGKILAYTEQTGQQLVTANNSNNTSSTLSGPSSSAIKKKKSTKPPMFPSGNTSSASLFGSVPKTASTALTSPPTSPRGTEGNKPEPKTSSAKVKEAKRPASKPTSSSSSSTPSVPPSSSSAASKKPENRNSTVYDKPLPEPKTPSSRSRSNRKKENSKAPKPPSAPPMAPSSSAPPPSSSGRSGLLSSIEGFSKGGLRKTQTIVKGSNVGGRVLD